MPFLVLEKTPQTITEEAHASSTKLIEVSSTFQVLPIDFISWYFEKYLEVLIPVLLPIDEFVDVSESTDV